MRILGRHGIAAARTLEQKISDAGPFNQRIDPHVLTPVRNALVKQGQIVKLYEHNAPWFHLASTPNTTVQERLNEQLPVFRALQHGNTGSRVGQCLEIAIYRALLRQNNLEYLGRFTNLDDHDDSQQYSKEEPPQSMSGRCLQGKQRLDFLVRHQEAGWAGIEAKNVREWLYPDREEVAELLDKAVALDCVPVLVGRRIPFVTFKVLSTCGVVFHQTYNQLLPEADSRLAEEARDKRLLGYHDIRVGNEPDSRLLKFIGTNLPRVMPRARQLFEQYKDLLADFAAKTIDYHEFAARVRRRSQGLDEDSDWERSEYYDE
ncbi:MAG: hypothetical protein JNM23_04870 [Bradyrhizobiaceae bacterium]|nr:hypothetical protein [Bradyrhizobiaceae bacterium]